MNHTEPMETQSQNNHTSWKRRWQHAVDFSSTSDWLHERDGACEFLDQLQSKKMKHCSSEILSTVNSPRLINLVEHINSRLIMQLRFSRTCLKRS